MQERRVIQGAFALSLLLHLVLAAVTWRIPLTPSVDSAMADDLEREVELFLMPDEEPADPADELPQAFTAVPERQASETAPENPDYLAQHHSLAADNKLGGDSDTPSADEEWLAEQVRIQKDEKAGADGVQNAQQPLPETESATSPTETGAAGQEREKVEGEDIDPSGEWVLPREDSESGGADEGEQADRQDEKQPELEDWWGGEAPTILKEGEQGAVGDRGFDFNQVARGKVQAGVAFNGDYSLNTYEWDYAPWMTRFQNELYRHWMAPYAYRIGVISGMTVIKLVIRKDGRVQSMEVLETDGHDSLHDASEAALKAFAPYWPLPEHFPEENLVITLGLHYPAFRR
ncbi:MAG: energy transducer TonB [Candidatus Krumholzibacteriota bacterium]